MPTADTQLPLIEILRALGRLPPLEESDPPQSPSPAAAALEKRKRKVTPHGRRKLAEDIWESIDGSPEAFELTPEQAAELQRRIDDEVQNPGGNYSWEEIEAEALAR